MLRFFAKVFFSTLAVLAACFVALVVWSNAALAASTGFQQAEGGAWTYYNSEQKIHADDRSSIYADGLAALSDVTVRVKNAGTGTCTATVSKMNAFTSVSNKSDALDPPDIAAGETVELTYHWTAGVGLATVASFLPYSTDDNWQSSGGTCSRQVEVSTGDALGTVAGTQWATEAFDLTFSVNWDSGLAVCGDGQVTGTEACDDGGSDSGDGCSSACAVESGWTCSGEPSACVIDYDPRESPSCVVYDPPNDFPRTFGSGILNDYVFRAACDVDSEDWPDDSLVWDYQIGDGDHVVLYDKPPLPFLAGNSYICRANSNCADVWNALAWRPEFDFADGDYSVRVRAKAIGFDDWGEWSPWVDFSSQGSFGVSTRSRPTCEVFSFSFEWLTGGETEGDGFSCLWDWVLYANSPSEEGLAFFYDSMTGFTGSSLFDDAVGVTDLTEAYCPLPTIAMYDFERVDLGEMPEWDLCAKVEEASAELLDVPGLDEGMAGLVAALALILGIRWFRKFVAG